ncbi:dicarboxylate/amino acid:cation symporter [Garciella nitratireducens]|uniref:Na+/H+-dicarboxylate symporter n=1 Tax=Garciella nitratireducens DSM 15102 TaxID=1121911 RepID=A0A1T4PB11_9FIRM|nr:dicarboxylate/amino acid:cation symporter [Garciella nitratireducens]SJZ88692.1 Na+/H+-dicarboxylate symporter [Garciella nitratireducens DSM 15102]
MSKVKDSLIVKLILAVIVGGILGGVVNQTVMKIIMPIKYVLGQFINFCVPLIIIGFITPSITKLKSNASKMLRSVLIIAYLSSVGAAMFSMISGYLIIPGLNIDASTEGLKKLPELVFQLDIPGIMPVMTALVFSIIMGLTIIWTNSKTLQNVFEEFNHIVLKIVNKMVIPILPIFIATTFAELAYEGGITKQLPVFVSVIVLVIVGHIIWLSLLYFMGGILSKKSPIQVFKHYGPAYLTAIGTMSSAATLSVALECARKSTELDEDIVEFTLPICSNIHLCGSVLTETFFVMTVSKILYGTLPGISTMIVFILLLGIFAIGAPGVPGGTVMASLGLITGVLGFDQSGVALILTIFALQDSFGTACNITGDGAIALMMTGLYGKDKVKA